MKSLSVSDQYLEGYVPPPRGEDLPYDDGEPMETELHREQMWLLIKSLQYHLHERGRKDVYVAGNMFVYFSAIQSRRNDLRGPDVFVVLDTDDHPRKSWVVWEENGRTPDIIIELLSPSTEDTDRGRKMDIYARILRTAFYVLYDPFKLTLEGYTLDLERRRYVPVPADERGYVRCQQLDLWLGVHPTEAGYVKGPMLRWIAPDGRVLPNDLECKAAHEARAQQETERAQLQAERARQEAERAQQEAERAQQEAERAQQQAERAQQEAERADREADRARRAELEVARLREELSRRG